MQMTKGHYVGSNQSPWKPKSALFARILKGETQNWGERSVNVRHVKMNDESSVSPLKYLNGLRCHDYTSIHIDPQLRGGYGNMTPRVDRRPTGGAVVVHVFVLKCGTNMHGRLHLQPKPSRSECLRRFYPFRLNNCVGRSNYKYFIALLLSTFFMTSIQLGLSVWFAVMYHSDDATFSNRGGVEYNVTRHV